MSVVGLDPAVLGAADTKAGTNASPVFELFEFAMMKSGWRVGTPDRIVHDPIMSMEAPMFDVSEYANFFGFIPEKGPVKLAGLNFSLMALDRIDLSDSDLTGANFAKADLTYANLERSNFTNANFEGATLMGTILAGAILEQANLKRARMHRADLEGARLDNADLTDADLVDARTSGAEISGATLRGARFSPDSLEPLLDRMTTAQREDVIVVEPEVEAS